MYIHYCEFFVPGVSINSTGQPIAIKTKYIKLALSNDSTHINFSSSNTSQTVLAILKQLPAASRTYKPTTKTWMISESGFKAFRQLIEAASLATFVVHSDVGFDQFVASLKYSQQAYNSSSTSAWQEATERKEEIKEEDFFYSSEAPLTATPVTQNLEAALLALFGLPVMPTSRDEIVRAYRKAALKYHPDRNGGDHSKMSELNSLWQQFKELILK